MNSHSVADPKSWRRFAIVPLRSSSVMQPLQNCGWESISARECAPGAETKEFAPFRLDEVYLYPDFLERAQI